MVGTMQTSSKIQKAIEIVGLRGLFPVSVTVFEKV